MWIPQPRFHNQAPTARIPPANEQIKQSKQIKFYILMGFNSFLLLFDDFLFLMVVDWFLMVLIWFKWLFGLIRIEIHKISAQMVGSRPES